MTLPRNWERLPSRKLEAMLAELTDDYEHDDVLSELRAREDDPIVHDDTPAMPEPWWTQP